MNIDRTANRALQFSKETNLCKFVHLVQGDLSGTRSSRHYGANGQLQEKANVLDHCGLVGDNTLGNSHEAAQDLTNETTK